MKEFQVISVNANDGENDNIGNDTVIVVSDDDADEEGNTQVKQELDIDYENPTSEFLLNTILYDSCKYEVEHPLTCIRTNTLYTIKNKTVDQITCDDNGAYTNSRSTSKKFFVDIEENRVKTVRQFIRRVIYFIITDAALHALMRKFILIEIRFIM